MTCTCVARNYPHDGKPGQCSRALKALLDSVDARPHREADRERPA